MSYYYKYEFVSPEPIFANIKEELKSYFDSGVLDDLMFETYLNQALGDLSKSSYKIEETVLELENFEARLPEHFISVREASLCTKDYISYKEPSVYYYQKDCRVTRINDSCHPCFTPTEPPCTPCSIPEKFRVTHKVTGHTIFEFTKQYLLTPGNISKAANCNLYCKNYGAKAPDIFDVAGNTFRTNFNTGSVYLIYYSLNFDDLGYQLVPDNQKIKKYVEKYIIHKCFVLLFNQATDESFNQLRIKKTDAEGERDEALIEARIELKKQTVEQKVRAIRKSYNRNSRFNIR